MHDLQSENLDLARKTNGFLAEVEDRHPTRFQATLPCRWRCHLCTSSPIPLVPTKDEELAAFELLIFNHTDPFWN
ncbi:MAG TPA: hypothetical protein VN112_18470 [Ensifer sp.]|nr:hypothetical protein [Ensifer sp.]